MNDISLKDFIIKYTLISSIVVWVLGSQIKDFLFNFISILIEPFFSIDLNENGEPDLKELARFTIKIGKIKIPLGKLLLETIKLVLQLIFMYLFIKYILMYTNLIDFKFVKK